jgi:hypothetical protein
MVMTVSSNTKKKYKIQKRTYRDANWFNAWFQGMSPHWSEWEDFKDAEFDEIDLAHAKQVELDINKKYFKHKIEYRLVKNV